MLPDVGSDLPHHRTARQRRRPYLRGHPLGQLERLLQGSSAACRVPSPPPSCRLSTCPASIYPSCPDPDDRPPRPRHPVREQGENDGSSPGRRHPRSPRCARIPGLAPESGDPVALWRRGQVDCSRSGWHSNAAVATCRLAVFGTSGASPPWAHPDPAAGAVRTRDRHVELSARAPQHRRSAVPWASRVGLPSPGPTPGIAP